MKYKLSPTFFRFARVGVVNTLLDIILFMALQTVLNIFFSTLISSSVGMMSSFYLNSKYTFAQRDFSFKKAILFLLTTSFILWILQPLIIHGVDNILQENFDKTISILIAKLFAVGICFVLNFLSYRYLVWPNKELIIEETNV